VDGAHLRERRHHVDAVLGLDLLEQRSPPVELLQQEEVRGGRRGAKVERALRARIDLGSEWRRARRQEARRRDEARGGAAAALDGAP